MPTCLFDLIVLQEISENSSFSGGYKEFACLIPTENRKALLATGLLILFFFPSCSWLKVSWSSHCSECREFGAEMNGQPGFGMWKIRYAGCHVGQDPKGKEQNATLKSKAISKPLEGTQKPPLGKDQLVFLSVYSSVGVCRERELPQGLLWFYKGSAQSLLPKAEMSKTGAEPPSKTEEVGLLSGIVSLPESPSQGCAGVSSDRLTQTDS